MSQPSSSANENDEKVFFHSLLYEDHLIKGLSLVEEQCVTENDYEIDSEDNQDDGENANNSGEEMESDDATEKREEEMESADEAKNESEQTESQAEAANFIQAVKSKNSALFEIPTDKFKMDVPGGNYDFQNVVAFQEVCSGTQRSGTKLVDNFGYTYVVRHRGKSNITWRCSVRNSTTNCTATVSQRDGIFVPGKKPHSHDPKPGELDQIFARKELRRKIQSQPFQSGMALAEHLFKQDGIIRPTVKMESVARMANRIRGQQRPREPNSLDFNLIDHYVPEDFLVGDVKLPHHRTLIFATQEQLLLLAHAKTWFIDWSSKIVRQPFYQLLCIHTFAVIDDSVKQVPLVYILMSDKRKRDYYKAFQTLKSKLPIAPRLSEVFADFEPAIWKALPRIFPKVTVLGCVCYFRMSIWGRIQELGLTEIFKEDKEVQQVLKELMVLPFLPSTHIPQTFVNLQKRIEGPLLEEVFKYVDELWISNELFTLKSWCSYGRAIRTLKDTEGWCGKLSAKAGGLPMGPYQLMAMLSSESELKHSSVTLINLRKLSKWQKGMPKTSQGRIFNQWERFEKGERTIAQLLQAASRQFGNQLPQPS